MNSIYEPRILARQIHAVDPGGKSDESTTMSFGAQLVDDAVRFRLWAPKHA